VPGAGDVLGVRMPVLRGISKRICRGDWRSFLEEPAALHEERRLRALVIAGAEMGLDERLSLTKGFVPTIDDWAVCDTFCMEWKVRGAADRERLWEYCEELIRSGGEFGMRASAVFMLAHFLDDGHIDRVLELLTAACHEGRYYRMGAAWALSCCFIRYPEKTEAALFSDSLDGGIRDMALRKVYDSLRVGADDKGRLRARRDGA